MKLTKNFLSAVTLLVACFAIAGCNSQTDPLAAFDVDPAATPVPPSVQDRLNALETKWDLATQADPIIAAFQLSPLQKVSFDTSLTWSLNRQLSSGEITSGNTLTDQIAAEYDSALQNNVSSSLVAAYRANDALYVSNCQGSSVPYSMNGIDGNSYQIVSSGSGLQILRADNSVYQTGFNTFNSACRYITSDTLSKRYAANLSDTGIRLRFPVKYKVSGGVGNFGRIQSFHGTMIADFCNRNFKTTDGLDPLHLCP